MKNQQDFSENEYVGHSKDQFPSTGYFRVDKVRHVIERQRDLDHQTNESVIECLNLATAKYFGVEGNFTGEQKALNALLIDINADPHTITLAWGTYVEIMKSETNV